MNQADEFKLMFDELGWDAAKLFFDDIILESSASSWGYLVDFTDSSTFRYYI